MKYWKFLNGYVVLILINISCLYTYASDGGTNDLPTDRIGELEYAWCDGHTYLANSNDARIKRVISAMENHWLKKIYPKESPTDRLTRLELDLHLPSAQKQPVLDRLDRLDVCQTIEVLEVHFFRKNYPREIPSARVKRLELRIYPVPDDSKTLKERVEKIQDTMCN